MINEEPNYWPRYTVKDHHRLRHQFSESEKIKKNWSQSMQDMFVLSMLDGKRNGVYVEIGADKFFSLNQVAKTVQEIGKKYGYDVPIEHGPPRHEVKHAYCDHTKAKDLLKFKDDTKLEELIENMFVWAMKQPKRKVKDMEYEVTEGIYDYWKN